MMKSLTNEPSIEVFNFRIKKPMQQNNVDCGPFILEYAERFFQDPLELFNKNLIVMRENEECEYLGTLGYIQPNMVNYELLFFDERFKNKGKEGIMMRKCMTDRFN